MAVVTETRTDTPPPTSATGSAATPGDGQALATLAWLLAQALVRAPLFP